MKLRTHLLAVTLLLLLPAAANAQKVVQHIELGTKETLGGTVRLANRQTLLLMSSADAPEVRVVALQPDGQTAWQSKLLKAQQVSAGSRSFLESADEAQRREARASLLAPVNVYSSGTDVYAVEVLLSDDFKNKKNQTGLKYGQTIVQHINEKGEVKRATFDEPERPKKVERVELGHYGDGNMYYVLAHEYNPRTEATEYVVEEYNITFGGRVARNVLTSLPPTPERSVLNQYVNEWLFLGHRPGQTYLARRLAARNKQDRPLQKNPMDFEVVVIDNAGARIGGFSSTMELPKGNWVAYSAYFMPNLLEQKHRNVYRGSSGIDMFRMTSGGYADFYLDYDSGECLIFGEYTTDHLPLVGDGHDVEGFFMRSFDPMTGQMLRKSQYAYPKDLSRKAGPILKPAISRACWFSLDPIKGTSEVTFASGGLGYNNEYLQLQFDKQLAHVGSQYHVLTAKDWKEHKAITHLTIARPVCLLRKSNGDNEEFRSLIKAEATDAPVYASVRKMHLAAVGAHPDVHYVLSGTGEAAGLLLEQMNLVGGKVTVYAF